MSPNRVKLAWVLYRGDPVPVSSFSRPHNLPDSPVLCPACHDPVDLKLGKIRTPHAAHRPDSLCPAQTGETALHLNTKLRLASLLRASRKLEIRQSCRATQMTTCTNTKKLDAFFPTWNRVEVEYSVGSRRPDIALLMNEDVVGAIEIYVTCPVTSEKAADLDSLSVPWIEVNANLAHSIRICGDSLTPIVATHQAHNTWRCPDCSEYPLRYRSMRNLGRSRFSPQTYGDSSPYPQHRLFHCYGPSGYWRPEVIKKGFLSDFQGATSKTFEVDYRLYIRYLLKEAAFIDFCSKDWIPGSPLRVRRRPRFFWSSALHSWLPNYKEFSKDRKLYGEVPGKIVRGHLWSILCKKLSLKTIPKSIWPSQRET